ncbi:DUF2917 domain-containing protein [Aromatoleum petrolei]|uniref:DUF2917 domain-containing protein n=1 Tax=Aromatoleum petrolei TaxID=76116 RepID=A0ABX1MV82_9RHOO|nr:DUF2917 domain-containing protein [Aromatoleum petrolei]NMF90240.1 DUF2917 domain-containing protein [Aromatoleum petrolei]QTQ35461.1 putative protein DUF2917 [Aromatoleum petrolei]
MRLLSSSGTIQLDEWSPLALRDARGLRVECARGRIWVTAEGQAGDFFLDAGDGMRIVTKGLVLIEGVPRGSVRLVADAPWPIRWASRLLSRVYRPRAQRAVGAAGAAV